MPIYGPHRKRPIPDPNVPKRPLAPLFLYMQNAREIIAAAFPPDVAKKVIGTEGVRRWKAMPEEEKKYWTDKYMGSLKLYEARCYAYCMGDLGDPSARDWSDEEARAYAENKRGELEGCNVEELLKQKKLDWQKSLEKQAAKKILEMAPTAHDETTYRRILELPTELQRMIYSHLPFYDAFTLRQTNQYFRNIIPPVRNIPALFAQLLEDNKKLKLRFERGDDDDDPQDDERDDWYDVLEELDKSPFMRACNVVINDDGDEIQQPLTERFTLVWIGEEPYWMMCDNCDRKVKMTQGDDYPYCWKCGGWNILSEVHEEQKEAEENNSIAQNSWFGAKRTFDDFAEGETDVENNPTTLPPRSTTRLLTGHHVAFYDRLLAIPQELQLEIFSHLPFYDLFSLRQTNRYFRNIIPPLQDIPALFAELMSDPHRSKPGYNWEEDDCSEFEGDLEDLLEEMDKSAFMSNCNLVIRDEGADGGGPMAERLSLIAAEKPTRWLICDEFGCRVKASEDGDDTWCWKCGGGNLLMELEEWEERNRIAFNSGFGAKRTFDTFAEGETGVEDSSMTLPPRQMNRLLTGHHVPLHYRLLILPAELQLEIFSHLPFYDLFSLRQTNQWFRNIIPPLVDIPALFAEFLTANTSPVDDEDDPDNEDGYGDDEDGYVAKEVLKDIEESSFMSICNLTILDVCSGDGPLSERLALVAAARPTSWMVCSGCEAPSKADYQYDAIWCWKCRTDEPLMNEEDLEEDERQRLHRTIMDSGLGTKRTFDEFAEGEADIADSLITLPPISKTRRHLSLYDRRLGLP